MTESEYLPNQCRMIADWGREYAQGTGALFPVETMQGNGRSYAPNSPGNCSAPAGMQNGLSG